MYKPNFSNRFIHFRCIRFSVDQNKVLKVIVNTCKGFFRLGFQAELLVSCKLGGNIEIVSYSSALLSYCRYAECGPGVHVSGAGCCGAAGPPESEALLHHPQEADRDLGSVLCGHNIFCHVSSVLVSAVSHVTTKTSNIVLGTFSSWLLSQHHAQ